MRIASISITNHRRVVDLTIEVRDHAVLVGPNGAGKSTVLRLVDLVLGSSWSQVVATLEKSHLRDQNKPLVVEVRLEGLDKDDLAHFESKVEVGTAGSEQQTWLTARLTANVSVADPDRLDISRVFAKPKVADLSITRGDQRQIGWTYLPANRSPDRDIGGGRASVTRALLQALSLDESESDAIQVSAKQLGLTLKNTASLQTLRRDLAAQLSLLLPDPVGTDELAIDLPSASLDEPLSDVDVQFDRDGERSTLAAQSDGLRSLTVVAVQLLARTTARILAIDEPEVHLHPRGQASLAALLASAPGQRLVATHAPAVLCEFQPTHAVAITRAGARQLAAAPFGTNVKQLHHWWVDGAVEPLTAERVIFVEGLSDRILVKRVAALLGHDLNRAGVSVVSLGGVNNFGPSLQLFGPAGFGVSALGLVDANEAHVAAAALGIDQANLASHDILVCDPDLEAEYAAALGDDFVRRLMIDSGVFSLQYLQGKSTTGGDPMLIAGKDLVAALRGRKVEAAATLAEAMTVDQASNLGKLKAIVDRAVAP